MENAIKKLTFEYYDQVDSTNDRIKERAQNGAEEGLVISAGCQTLGRGRNGRKWHSTNNKTIATSILLRPDRIRPENIPTITLVAALGVRAAIEKVCGMYTQIKWPNDIIIDGKKLCGILTEMQMKDNKVDYVVLGIGVNVHNDSFSEDIAFKATSIDIELGKRLKNDINVSRKEITNAIWESFALYYKRFRETDDMTNIKNEYEKYLVNAGKTIRVEDGNGGYEAIAKGINEKGALIVEIEGKEKEINGEEVSVRGVYGYV